jgi:hypothetical protein
MSRLFIQRLITYRDWCIVGALSLDDYVSFPVN